MWTDWNKQRERKRRRKQVSAEQSKWPQDKHYWCPCGEPNKSYCLKEMDQEEWSFGLPEISTEYGWPDTFYLTRDRPWFHTRHGYVHNVVVCIPYEVKMAEKHFIADNQASLANYVWTGGKEGSPSWHSLPFWDDRGGGSEAYISPLFRWIVCFLTNKWMNFSVTTEMVSTLNLLRYLGTFVKYCHSSNVCSC